METAKRTTILLLLALLTTGATQSAEKQAATVSNTRTASCLVKITCDSAILPLNLETIDYLLHSSGVGGRACREVLGISPDQDYDLFTVEYVQPLASDDLGGIGIPPMGSQAGRSSMSEEGMNEYEYAMMMEKEMREGYDIGLGPTGTTSSTRSSRTAGSSFRDRDRDRGSRTNRTIEPFSNVNSSDRRRGRGGYTTASTAPQQRIRTTTTNPTDEQTELFSLSVELPEDVKPLAKEYMKALVDNLRQALTNACDEYEEKLENMLQFAESRRERAQSQLAKAMEQTKAIGPAPVIEQNPADTAVHERLEQIVDLSVLEAGLSFAEVIEILSNSVDPPLQIQPNWKDLLENGEVEPTTPAGMDPLTGVKLRKALEVLLAGVSSEFAEISYVVDEGVIIIATIDALPSKMVPCVYEIPALSYSPGSAKELADAIQNTIDPESWFELSDVGKGTITPYPRQRPRKLAILQTYENHQKIWEFLQSITIDIPAGRPLDIPVEMLLSEKNNLLREKQNLEMDLARFQGRMPAIEEQISRIRAKIEEKVQDDQVSEELRKILALQVNYLEGVKKLVDSGSVGAAELADAEEKLARARIELARRNEQIGASAGTDQLAKFSNELAMQAIDMAEKNAMLKAITNQLDQTEQQLTAVDVSDPQISRIRMATQSLEVAERRVNELNARLVNLQLPMVSVLGGE
jgi:hypothetical protein